MITEIVALIVGVVLSLGFIRVARSFSQKERLIYTVGLCIGAFAYLVLGLFRGANTEWLAYEALGFVLFAAMAWVGLRYAVVLAAGWAAHVLWDLLLHLHGPGAVYIPDWYPWVCVSFDLIVAAAVLKTPK